MSPDPAKPLAAQRRTVEQLLIAQGVVSEDQLRIALLEQTK